MHFIFNMLALFFFASSVERVTGTYLFLFIYFGSLMGGSLLALYLHKNHSDYRAVGASGAVSGIVFSAIFIAPFAWIRVYLIPMPALLFGLIYTIYSIYGIKSQKDDIGHDAHLGGGIIGMLLTGFCAPQLFIHNYYVLLLIALPTIVFITLIIKKPEILLIKKGDKKIFERRSIEYSYNEQKSIEADEIDAILDKINKKGLGKLNKKEKRKLDELSKN